MVEKGAKTRKVGKSGRCATDGRGQRQSPHFARAAIAENVMNEAQRRVGEHGKKDCARHKRKCGCKAETAVSCSEEEQRERENGNDLDAARAGQQNARQRVAAGDEEEYRGGEQCNEGRVRIAEETRRKDRDWRQEINTGGEPRRDVQMLCNLVD